MRNKRIVVSFPFLALVAAFAGPRAVHALTVDLPCANGASAGASRPYLRSCAELLNGVPTAPNAVARPGMLSQIKRRMMEQIDGDPARGTQGYYQNVDPDQTSTATVPSSLSPSAGATPGRFFGPTLCNLIPGELSLIKETTQDHHGKSCGLPLGFKASVGTCSTIIGTSDCCDSEPNPPAKVPAYTTWHPDPNQYVGGLEQGYVRGGLVAATQCFYKSVTNEIQRAPYQLQVNNVLGQPSACMAMMLDYSNQLQSLKTYGDSLKSKLSASSLANINDIFNCEKQGLDANATVIGMPIDKMGLRQSAQHLCAMRFALESMVTQVVACEIFARSSAAWNNAIYSPGAQAKLTQKITDDIINPCYSTCQSTIRAAHSSTVTLGIPPFAISYDCISTPTVPELENCAKSCYRGNLAAPPRIQTLMENYLGSMWPADGSACLYAPLGLAFIRRRRRPRRKSTAPPRAGAGILIAAAFLSQACDSSSSAPPAGDLAQYHAALDPCNQLDQARTSSPDPNARTAAATVYAEQCCPPSSSCPAIKQTGQGSVIGSLVRGRNDGDASSRSFASAVQLEDPVGGDAVLIGGLRPQIAPAVGNANYAPELSGFATGGGTASPAVSFSRSSGAKDSPETRRKSGLPNYSGLVVRGGGSGDAAPLSTSVLSSNETQAASAAGLPAPAHAGEGEGETNGYAPTRAGGYESVSGAAPEELAAAGETETLEFGPAGRADQGAREVPASLDADPDDYFGRTRLKDSLFKVVERVYRKKTMTWIRADLGPRRVGAK